MYYISSTCRLYHEAVSLISSRLYYLSLYILSPYLNSIMFQQHLTDNKIYILCDTFLNSAVVIAMLAGERPLTGDCLAMCSHIFNTFTALEYDTFQFLVNFLLKKKKIKNTETRKKVIFIIYISNIFPYVLFTLLI